MLILLPLAAYILLVVTLIGEDDPAETAWRAFGGAFLRAAVLWGAYLALSTEILSFVKAITSAGIGLVWLGAIAVVGLIGWRRESLRRGLRRLRGLPLPNATAELAILVGLVVVCGSLFVVAWLSPPNNFDSMLYHMSRVTRWAQQRSLDHYATASSYQLFHPTWAETAILHLRVLWGSDRPANLVQWFSMVGALIGSMTVASQLGAGRAAVWLAAAFVASIPMGVLQATSTENDYATALWMLCTAFLILRVRSRPSRLDSLCLALALGLGFLTKGTFLAFAPAFVVWFIAVRVRQVGPGRTVLEGFAIAALAMTLSLGFWARNVATFGSPYGPLQSRLWVAQFVQSPDSGTEVTAGAEPPAGLSALPGAYGAKFVRTVAYQMGTPIGVVRSAVLSGLRRLPSVFDDAFAEDWSSASWNHEDTAGSPVHFALFVGAAAFNLLRRPPVPARAREYTAAVAAGFLLLVLLADDHGIDGISYQLPVLVLAGPMTAVAASALLSGRTTFALSGVFLVLAVPVVLFNNTRPLVGAAPWPTRSESVLVESPRTLLLAATPGLQDSYVRGTELIREADCNQVGLRIDSGDPEYAFWWLLGAPQSGFRIETVYPVESLQRLVDPTFRPCAVLCTICGDRQRLHGLPLAAEFPGLDVFIGSGYVADPDG